MKKTSSIFFGRNVLEEALAADASIQQIYFQTEAAKTYLMSLKQIREKSIPTKFGIPATLKKESHQGVAFETSHKFYESWDAIKKKNPRSLLFCNHLEDVHNLGSLIRLGVAFGVDAIVHEEKRSASLTGGAMKSSAGLAFRMPLVKVERLSAVLSELKSQKFSVCAMSLEKNSKNLFDWKPQFPLALVLGSEGEGIAPDVLKLCTEHIRIPMDSGAESLNVSHAAAIALNWVFRQRSS